MVHEDFLQLNNSGDLLLIRAGDLLVLRETERTHGGGGGGKPRKEIPIRIEFLKWPIYGQLLVTENMDIIGRLLTTESIEAIGSIRHNQLIEAFGRISVLEHINLNGKLRAIISKNITTPSDFKTKEKKLSIYNILLDLLDDF